MLRVVQRAAQDAFRKSLALPRGPSTPCQFILNASRNHPQSLRQYSTDNTGSNHHTDAASTLRDAILSMERSLENLEGYADIDKLSQDIQNTQTVLEDPNLWLTSPAGAAEVQSRLSDMQHQLSTRRRLRTSFERLKELSALAERAGDSDLQSTVLLDLQGLIRSAEEHLISLLLSDLMDQNSAYIDIRSSTEGTEASDWVSMLARMYTKWARSRDYAVRVVDMVSEDGMGVKPTTLLVEGRYAYGYAQYESGIHRLVRRLSGNDVDRNQTSLATVHVSPCVDDGPSSTLDLEPADIRITTDSYQSADGRNTHAVRAVHIPTGITVSCQQEASEYQNRTLALSLLRAKLYDLELQNNAESSTAVHRRTLPADFWDSEIRSYTLVQPREVVKDLRTGYEVASGAVQGVLNGHIGGFMEASLRKFKRKA